MTNDEASELKELFRAQLQMNDVFTVGINSLRQEIRMMEKLLMNHDRVLNALLDTELMAVSDDKNCSAPH